MMPTAPIDTLIQHLRRAVLVQDEARKTDGQLLESFLGSKDEAAFAALVRRHGPMVLSVCRRVVGNHHDAEDAFQVTFLVLARKASAVKPREMVANWLHGVAYRTGLKARALAAKRQAREQQVPQMPEPEAMQHDQWHDLQPLLDQELNGLPKTYRLAIVLCDLEGKSIKEATRQLGCPQGTLAGRLARGRKMLAKRLANRGVVLSAGALAAIIAQKGAAANVPTALMMNTVQAATLIAARQALASGTISTRVAALTEGVLKTMFLSKMKTANVILFVAAMLLFGSCRLMFSAPKAEHAREPEQTGGSPTKGFPTRKSGSPTADACSGRGASPLPGQNCT
jgi:RNA polymerase sigma factor (sigma-70 family)